MEIRSPMIQILHVTKNTYFDLDDNASLSFNHKNNYFDLEDFTSGDGVVSFDLPASPTNNLLLNHYNSVASNQEFEEVDVIVFLNSNFLYKGKLGINKYSTSYNCYILIGKSALHKTLSKKIKDIDLPDYNLLMHNATVGTNPLIFDYTAYMCYGVWKSVTYNTLTFHFRFFVQNLETSEFVVQEFTGYGGNGIKSVCDQFNTWLGTQTGWITNSDFIFVYNAESTNYLLMVIARKTANNEHILTSNTHPNNQIPQLVVNMPLPTDQWDALDFKVYYESQQLAIAVKAFAVTNNKIEPYVFLPVGAENFAGNDKWLGTINMVKPWTNSGGNTANPGKIPMMQYNSYWDGCSRHFAIVPFFSLKWLINKCFDYIEAQTGFGFDREILEGTIVDTYIFNTKALDRSLSTNSGFTDDQEVNADVYAPEILTNDHIPSTYEIGKILTLVRKLTCSSLKVDYARQQITFIKYNDSANKIALPIITDVTTALEIDEGNFNDYAIAFKDESSDAIFNKVEFDANNLQLSVNELGNDNLTSFTPQFVGKNYDVKFNEYKLYRYKSGYKIAIIGNNAPNSYTIRALDVQNDFVGYLHDTFIYPKNKTKKIELPFAFLPLCFPKNALLKVDNNNGRVVKIDAYSFYPETARAGVFVNVDNANIENQHFNLLTYGQAVFINGSRGNQYVFIKSNTLTAQDIYNQYYKTFFKSITGRKVQLTAMLTKQLYEEILQKDFFIFQNRKLIFTEMDVNFQNKTVLNNRIEAKIRAYIC